MGTKDELENNKKKNAPPAIDKMTTLDEITKPLNRTKDTSTDTRNVKKVNFTSPHFISNLLHHLTTTQMTLTHRNHLI